MSALVWGLSLLACLAAAVLPVRMSFVVLLVLLPVGNAFGIAAAAGLVVARWLLLDVEEKDGKPAGSDVPLLLAYGFLALALVVSALVSAELDRLASEGAQWLLGILLFTVIVRSPRTLPLPLLARGFIAGAALLAVVQAFCIVAKIEIADDSPTPFLSNDANNYSSYYYVIGLVVLPMAVRGAIPGVMAPILVAAGMWMVWINESRAQILLGAMLLIGWLIQKARNRIVAIASSGALAIVGLGVAFQVARIALYDSQSLLSLANVSTNYSNLERIALMVQSVDHLLTYPLGAGLGASSIVYSNSPYTVGTYPTAHNTLAMLMVELGWYGVLGYVATMGALALRAWRTLVARDPIAFLIFMLMVMTVIDAVFFSGPVAMVFWVLLGLAVPRDTAPHGLMAFVPADVAAARTPQV